jgi:hypothetical protein
MNYNFYQPSGKYAPSAIILSILFILIGVPILSSVYSLIIWYIPFIYLNFIATAGLGIILAWVLNRLLKIGKVRNTKFASFLALIVGVFAVYFVWTSYITLLYNAGDTMSAGITSGKAEGLSLTKTFFNIWDFIGISLTPSSIPETMSYLYDNGSWGIKSITVKGIFLALIWLIEAVIIVLLTWSGGTDQADEPFSEQSNSWFDKETLPYKITMPEDFEKFKDELSNGKSSVLQSLDYNSQNGKDYGQITTFSHPNEMEAFMNFENIKVTLDKDGKEDTSTNVLIKNVKISMSDLSQMNVKPIV